MVAPQWPKIVSTSTKYKQQKNNAAHYIKGCDSNLH